MAAFVSLVLALSINQSKALTIFGEMDQALAAVETVRVDFQQRPSSPERREMHIEVLASRDRRYWGHVFPTPGVAEEYGVWNGKQLVFHDEAGKLTTVTPPSEDVIVNQATASGQSTADMFFNRARYQAATLETAFYLHDEEIEGRMCSLVGLTKTVDRGGPMSSVRYYWVDQENHLPRAFQIHSVARGTSILGDRRILGTVEINPVLPDGWLENMPAQMAVAKPDIMPTKPVATAAKVGAACPTLPVQTTKYKSVPLNRQLGKWTVVTFWAPWCGPCRSEMEALAKLSEVKSGALKVIAIGCSDSKMAIRKAAEELGYPFTWVFDPDAESSRSALKDAYGVDGIPHAFLYAADGRLVRHWLGFSDVKTLKKELRLPTTAPKASGPKMRSK